MRLLIATIAFFLVSEVAIADIIMLEDFEDASVNYSISSPDDFAAVADSDYYGIVNAGTGLPGDITYANPQGNGFYGAQDTNGPLTTNPVDVIVMDYSINISNYENLAFSMYVAEDDSTDGFEDWDSSSSMRVEYQIDGGGFFDLFAIESEIGTDGNQTNEAAREDTDFNTVGDGAEITDTFSLFSKSLIGTGSVLDLRLTIEDLNTGDEDIAMDNILIEGDFVGVPEPSSLIFVGAISALLLLRRRRR